MDRNWLKGDLVARGDVAAALGLLTRLPVRVDTAVAMARGARAAWAWPVAGLIVAIIAGLAGAISAWLGLPAALVACVVIAAQVIVTGAMHEDGLADSVDGLWGGWTPERRLAIMKDSRTGAYGVIALVLALLTRWVGLSSLIAVGHLWVPLLLAGMFSRVPMVALMVWLPGARPNGLSQSVGRPGPDTLWLSVLIAAVTGLAMAGSWAIPVAIVVGLTALIWGLIARVKIGGQTGDILGASQQLSEIGVLMTLAALLTDG
jgi:adenosylcobinamide-GDP ribazoletransferase